ncbi:MAG: DUF4332 domain-containing protein [Anaerolineae bacterium]
MAEVTEIGGIGQVYAQRLAEARIGTTQVLLKRGATSEGREKIAKKAGVSARRVLTWVNKADLMRIKGVGKEYANLLDAAAVHTVKQLAQQRPDRVTEKLLTVNEERYLVQRVPGQETVEEWIKAARHLPPILST